MTALPKALATALLGVLLLTGCTGGSDDSSATSASDSGGESAGLAAPEIVGDAAAPAPPADVDSGRTEGAVAIDARALPGAAVIRTADLQVQVDDVRQAADEAARLVRELGGELAAEDRSGSAEDGSATLRLRVPPEGFGAAVAGLAALGEERGRRLGSEDVTDAVVDLEARLTTQRASVARVQALLAEASNLGEVVQIEGELTRRTADLESLEARLASLEAQVSLSTITLALFTDGDDEPVAGAALGFGDGLRNGWEAVTTVARVLAVTAGALLPFVPLVLVGGYFVLRSRRARPVA